MSRRRGPCHVCHVACVALLLPLAGCEACFTILPIEGARAEVVRSDDGALEQVALALGVDVIASLETDIDGLEVAHAYVPIDDSGDAFPLLIDIGHNKIGHPPVGVWTVPHFDIHFYALTEEQVDAVTCADQPTVADEKIPEGFVVGECVDRMGVHAHAPHAEGSSDPAPLADVNAQIIIGYDQGELTFIEPMLFAESVFQGEALDADIGRPATLGRATLWPARFEGRLDEEANEYRFQLVDWSPIE
jgi:hypothetical protein